MLAANTRVWHMLTSDSEVLKRVTGQRIAVDSTAVQARPAVQPTLSASQTESVDTEISKLIAKSVIRLSEDKPGEFIIYLPYLVYRKRTDCIK